MKIKNLILLILTTVIALGLTGCKTLRRAAKVPPTPTPTESSMQHQVGTVISINMPGTNILQYNERVITTGAPPARVIDSRQLPPHQQFIPNNQAPANTPPPQNNNPFIPTDSYKQKKDRSLGAMVAQYHAENGVVGGSQLLPKPVRDSEMSVAVQWSGINGTPPTYYFHDASKGSHNNETFINGQLAAASSQTWDNTATDIQLPIRGGCCQQQCTHGAPAGTLTWNQGSYNPGGFSFPQDNYKHGGRSSSGRGYVAYNPTQLGRPRGNQNNFYYTGRN